jgi:hypothetical protein
MAVIMIAFVYDSCKRACGNYPIQDYPSAVEILSAAARNHNHSPRHTHTTPLIALLDDLQFRKN